MNRDYIILKNIVSKELCEFLCLEFTLMETVCQNLYPNANLSDLCENTFARYSPLMMEALSVYVQPILEKELSMKLYPAYSYARIYYNGSKLQKHFDRASSEISVSVCLSKEIDWPLYIKNEQGTVHKINLDIGDIVIYCGRKHEHWRDPYEGHKQIQAFLQYVDAEGSSAYLKWDTRPALGMPFEYAKLEVQEEIKKIASVRDLLKNTGLNN